MTRASNWDEIIRAANVMVRFLFSTSLWALVVACMVLVGEKRGRWSMAGLWQPGKHPNTAEGLQGT